MVYPCLMNPDLSFLKILYIQISRLLKKPSDQDLHFFFSACKYMLITGMLQVIKIKIGEECST